MKQIPIGTELARPFMPAKDFDLSRKFYETIGFEKLLDGDVAIFRAGSGGFILQRHYQNDWAENFMMQLMVTILTPGGHTLRGSTCPENSMSRLRARRLCSHGAFGSLISWIHPECFGTSANGETAKYRMARA